MAWRDEHTKRHGRIQSNDWVVMRNFADGMAHFVRVKVTERGVTPISKLSACGLKLPNWKLRPRRHELSGQVDCSGCIQAYQDSVAAS